MAFSRGYFVLAVSWLSVKWNFAFSKQATADRDMRDSQQSVGASPHTPGVYEAWGKLRMLILVAMGWGSGNLLPLVDIYRHPVRLSLGGSLSSVARLRFTGPGKNNCIMGSRSIHQGTEAARA